MPTFSQNPHIDYWPVGASLQPNNEFVNGSTAGYSAVSPTNCSAVLSSNIGERAPYTVSLGSAQLVTTVTTAAAAVSKLGTSTDPSQAFVSGSRAFAEIWVKVLSTTGTVGAMTINPNFVMYTSAGAYLAVSSGSTVPVTSGGGWTRAWSTVTGATLIGQQATAARVAAEAQLNIASASAGATVTWVVGKVNIYITAAATTTMTLNAGGTLLNAQGTPYTAGPNAQTQDMVEAFDWTVSGGGPISIS